jgi:hypothetical protein
MPIPILLSTPRNVKRVVARTVLDAKEKSRAAVGITKLKTELGAKVCILVTVCNGGVFFAPTIWRD